MKLSESSPLNQPRETLPIVRDCMELSIANEDELKYHTTLSLVGVGALGSAQLRRSEARFIRF